jgi:hypothetical protein
VLTYGATFLTMPSPSAAVAKKVAAATEAEPETMQVRTPSPTGAPRAAIMGKVKKFERRTKPRPEPREVKPGNFGQDQRVACLPRYDSSGAQTSAC